MPRNTLVARLALAALVAALSACTLLTSVDGLSGGAGPGGSPDGGPDAPSSLGEGGGGDGGGNDGAVPIGDADVDARAQLYAAAVLADKPRGYWRMEETAAGAAKVETGVYPGKYNGAVTYGEPGVAGGRAVKLPTGLLANVSVASTAFRFPGTAPHSVELWVKAGVIQDFAAFASTELTQVGATRSGWTILCDATGIIRYEVYVTNGGPSQQVRGYSENTTPLTAGAFHHVVVVYDGANVLGYLDGMNESAVPNSMSAPDVGELRWGCRSDGTMCLDDWTIDELAIYDHALASDRVKAHHELGK